MITFSITSSESCCRGREKEGVTLIIAEWLVDEEVEQMLLALLVNLWFMRVIVTVCP